MSDNNIKTSDLIKNTANPKVVDLISKSSERRYNLSDIDVHKLGDVRFCLWCAREELKSKRMKYCSELCSKSAFASMNPQSPEGLHVLLHRQDYKCNDCGFDYKPFVDKQVEKAKKRNIVHTLDKINWWIFKTIKMHFVKDLENRNPEIDHIQPISLGGQGLGFDNHQVLCKECHLNKTKTDMGNIAKHKANVETKV